MVTYSGSMLLGPDGQAGDDAVFRALADPTRRAILDALFELDGQSVQALCGRFPSMTRFGVMKHLGVLEAANLVSTRKIGRTKQHFHNPVPIQLIADRWIAKYAKPFTRAMADLHHALGGDSHAASGQHPVTSGAAGRGAAGLGAAGGGAAAPTSFPPSPFSVAPSDVA
jgi:DNA-binding transcriptional ArsR family regulator